MGVFRFNPWSRKIPHASKQIGAGSTTTEPALEPTSLNYGSPRTLEPVLCNRRRHRNEEPGHRKWRVVPARRNSRKPVSESKLLLLPLRLSRMLWGSWAPDPSYVPCFLFVGNRLQPPWPSLRSKRQVQTVTNQGREGTQRQRRSSQEAIVQGASLAVQGLGFLTSSAGSMGSIPDRGTKTPHATETTAQPWDRVLVRPQGIHVTVSLSSSAELKPPTNGRC